jgi:putative MFS transporter
MACGFLADKFGRRTIFTYSLLWYTGANLLMAFQTSAIGINFWRFVAGLGIGVELVVIGAYISELVPRQIRGRAFACEQAIGFLSVPVVALLSYLFVPRHPLGFDGWRWVVIIGCHGALFVWYIRRQLPESPRWLAEKGRLVEADEILSLMESKIEMESNHPLPKPRISTAAKPPHTFRVMWRAPYRKRVVMMTVFNVFQTVGFYGFANWVPTLLIKQGITVTTSLLFSTIIAVAAPIGPIAGLLIGDRFERKTMIMVMAAVITACGIAFSHSSAPLVVIAMGVGLTLASNCMSYSFHAYQSELFPTSIRASAVGFVYSWSRFSAIFTSFIIAGILKDFGTGGVFLFISIAMMIVIVSIGLMGPKTLEVSLEQISPWDA